MLCCNNILLVEDDVDDQILFIEALKQLNNNVKYTIAYDGKDALDKLKVLKHLPDLIFLDINMPRMNGFEFLTYLNTDSLFSPIPVIVLSTSNNIAEKVFQQGAFGYIVKPTSTRKLQSEIEHVFELVK